MIDDGVRSMAGEEMELLGGVSGPVPEKFEVVVQGWVGVVEGVQVEYVMRWPLWIIRERPQWSPFCKKISLI